MIEFLDGIDKSLFLFLNACHSDFWDPIMWWISGKSSWIFLYVLILVWLGVKHKWRILIIMLFVILLVTATDQISVHFFKNVFQRFRPCHNPELKQLVHLVHNHCGGKFGFVSSHAANTFGVAIFSSALIKNKYYKWFILLWAALVSYSRIYLGVHYPGDILGGALLGAGIGFLFARLYTLVESRYLNNICFFNN